MRVGPGEQAGLTNWDALLPTDASVSMWAAIETLAAQYRADNPQLTVAQSRADALVDLVLSDVQVTTTATLIIPTTSPPPADPADPAGHADPAERRPAPAAAGRARRPDQRIRRRRRPPSEPPTAAHTVEPDRRATAIPSRPVTGRVGARGG